MAIDVADYIRRAALARGIDPNVALTVARSEGGLKNPFRHGEGPAPKSQDPRFGNLENSYGPFQLYISGTNSGLGDRALAAGVDPRKNWQAGVDFALDEARNKGWGQWYGAKARGITGMMGIGGAPIGSMAPQTTQTALPAAASASAAPQLPISPSASPDASQPTSASQYLAALGSMAPAQGPQFSPVQIMGPSQGQANGLSSLIATLLQNGIA